MEEAAFLQLQSKPLELPSGAEPSISRGECTMDLSAFFKSIPAVSQSHRSIEPGKQSHRAGTVAISGFVAQGPARSFESLAYRQDSRKTCAISRRATSTRKAKGLDPNGVRADFAMQIEFGEADFVECFNLEGLAHGG